MISFFLLSIIFNIFFLSKVRVSDVTDKTKVWLYFIFILLIIVSGSIVIEETMKMMDAVAI